MRRLNDAGTDLPPLSVTKDRGVVLQSEKYNKRIATDPRKYLVAKPGEFVYDAMSLYYGAIGRVTQAAPGLVSPDYVLFEVDDSVDHDFLQHLFRSDVLHDTYESLAEGGNQHGKRRRIYWSVFESIRVRLPPLDEQRRIATLLAAIDAAVVADTNLERALIDFRRRLMDHLFEGAVSAGRTAVLADVAVVQTGIAKSKANVGAGKTVPYLSVANVKDGLLDLALVKSIDVDDRAAQRFALRDRDVLFCEGGDADKVGRGTIWRSEIPGCLHQNHVFAVRTDRSRLLPEFLDYYRATTRGRRYFLDAAKQTTNLASINSSQLRAMPVPVPAVGVQEEVVRAIAALDARLEVQRAVHAALFDVKKAVASRLLQGESP
ncbi:MAG: hypothetical protein K8H88_02765 [Sandaracinaceae bacterium]|nr:hypothetical protein [Sandaracinaceae bacterium]